MNSNPLIALKKSLHAHGIEVKLSNGELECSLNKKTISFYVVGENSDLEKHQDQSQIPFDYIFRELKKTEALILSKLQVNKKVFARKCEIKKVDKPSAVIFLDNYHLMDSTQSAYNLGLYFEGELVALASFSKGRKMNRLEAHQRSFELIRFCTKSGITVTGGLTRLVKKFCEEKKAGDLMTYIDKELFDGRSFIAAGFKKHSETEPNYFLINKTTFERTSFKKEEKFDKHKFYLTHNSGSLKLVYTPLEQI